MTKKYTDCIIVQIEDSFSIGAGDMTRHILIATALPGATLGIMLVAGCPNIASTTASSPAPLVFHTPPTPTPVPTAPPAGQAFGHDIEAKFYPAIAVGQRWTYLTTFPDGATDSFAIQVTEVRGNDATASYPGFSPPTQPFSVNAPMTMFGNGMDSFTTTSEGTEGVAVPFGHYAGAAKVKGTSTGVAPGTIYFWLAPDIGLVKWAHVNNNGTMSYELTNFSQP